MLLCSDRTVKAGIVRKGSWVVAGFLFLSSATSLSAESDPDSTEAEENVGFGIAPIAGVTYSKETGVMFGASASFFYKYPKNLELRDTSVTAALVYSLRNQASLIVRTDLYFFEDDLQVESRTAIESYPNSYFGIGNNTELGDEERYSPTLLDVKLFPRWRVHPRLYLGAAIRFLGVDMREVEDGGMLASGSVPGCDGGTTTQIGVSGMYDSRDNTLYPYSGLHATWSWYGGVKGVGSDNTRSQINLDARLYIPMPFDRHVLAFQGIGEVRSGKVPFYDMGKLGGLRLLRGNFEGRFRDRQLWSTQIEYRLPLVWRFGMVAFGGVGDVADQVEDFRLNELKFGVGGGIRFAPSKKAPVNVRLDVAKSKDDFGFYVDVGEAF